MDVMDDFLGFLYFFGKTLLMVFICLFVILGIPVIVYDLEMEPERQRIIEVYKKQLTAEEIKDIELICNNDLKCWDKERAILSGMQVKKETKPKNRRVNVYYKNGVKIYED